MRGWKVILLLQVVTLSAGARWGSYEDKGCVRCGEKVFHSRLLDISGDWMAACRVTYGRPPGSTDEQLPFYCEDKGIGGMWGHFNVSTPWGVCDTGSTRLGGLHWGDFRNDGCAVAGHRLFSARLWNIDGSWDEACRTTTGRPLGEDCVVPTRCEDGGVISGMWGKFYIPDSYCD